MSTSMLYHCLSYRDARAALEFLSTAFGFVENGVYAAEDDPATVLHAQLDWPLGGGIMLGSVKGRDDRFVGRGRCYCVTETDADVDRIHAQALAPGARSVRAPEDMDYGGRGCTVDDPEGNEWSFGSYPGE